MDTTDRELLELAAKSLGRQLRYNETYGVFCLHDGDTEVQFQWEPLDDDDDMLRLSVKRKIDIVHSGSVIRAIARGDDGNVVDVCEVGAVAGTGGVRRIVVMAAAAIGRAMP
jgi:hypothetical protein